MTWTRRRFLKTASASLGLGGTLVHVGCGGPPGPRSPVAGGLVPSSDRQGHRIYELPSPKPDDTRSVGVAIVGGGISGLAAGWKLDRSGCSDLVVLELEPRIGGTSCFGESPTSAFPWGAHYIPFPSDDGRVERELLTELGVIEGTRPDGTPIYGERHICFAPQERLFIHGRWQEGLWPSSGATARDTAQYRRFQELMAAFRARRDRQGRRAFALPLERSSRDPDLMELDRISMREFLVRHRLDSPRLAWYVEYGCRDDFGLGLDEASAWVGIHYFAARATGEEGQVLTWPEGNGFVVKRLAKRLGSRVLQGQIVHRVEPARSAVEIDSVDAVTGRVTRWVAREAILAIPKFVVKYVVRGLPDATREALGAFAYSPWMVANLHVDRVPEGPGAPPCWDNVIYDSTSLGYVVATHQHVTTHPGPSVLTYYRSYYGQSPAIVRRRMLQTPWEAWRDSVLEDLRRAHTGIDETVRQIDVMLLAHAMIRPTVGFVWGAERRRSVELGPRLHAAHCDSGGLPLFEEALYRGVAAAEAAMQGLGLRFESSFGSVPLSGRFDQ